MTENSQQTETPPTGTETPPPADGSQSQFKTVEEAEAHWQNRISGKDKAHAAETNALRDELSALKRANETLEKAQAESRAASLSEADRWKQQFEEAEKKLRDATNQFLLDNRKVKYPKATEFLGEDGLLSFDEGRLAAIETRLVEPSAPQTPPPVIDKNTPPRTPGEPPGPKSSAELKADLVKLAPGFRAEIGG